MSIVLFAAGSICLLYFIILAIRHVDFCLIWLVGAMGLFAAGGYLKYRTLCPSGFVLPAWLSAMFCIFLAAGILSFLATEVKMIHAMSSDTNEEVDYLIVLGAQVKKTVPSKALKLRLDTACVYLKEHPQTKAVLSGGQGPGEEISEALCMYQYLTDQGVKEEQLLMEPQSTTTAENLIYSAEVIKRSLGDKTPKQAYDWKTGIVSNNFHIYRATKLAEKAGYKKVWGIAAPSDWKLQIHYMVREYFAIIKAKIRGDI